MKKNEIFRFKNFEIRHQVNAQKISTDSVLLGAWADVKKSKKILDIGAGCGVLALMTAQRNFEADIVAIEIEKSFAEEARTNIENSPFSSKIILLNEDIRNYPTQKFDHIICNPPYFSNSLKSDVDSRNQARHDLNLTFENLAEIASRLLNSNGKISIVIPFLKLEEVIKSFKCFELHLSRINHVKHTKQNQTSISLLEFQMVRSDLVITSDFFIRDENGFSEVYKNLLSDFLIIF